MQSVEARDIVQDQRFPRQLEHFSARLAQELRLLTLAGQLKERLDQRWRDDAHFFCFVDMAWFLPRLFIVLLGSWTT